MYIDHPIGELNGNGNDRGDHFAGATEWLRFLAETTQWHLCVPWWPLVIALSDVDKKMSGRVVVDTNAVQERCDMLALTGGIVSPHMRGHARKARQWGQPTIDLTPFGVLPPPVSEEEALRVVEATKSAIASRPRRVWMPLMSGSDMKTLQRARHGLYIFPEAYDDEVALLDRIISAIDGTKPD